FLRARARVLAWPWRASSLRRCRQLEIRMACASGWRGAATASTACSNRLASGSVIPVGVFPPPPPPLQHQEPHRQHHQTLVVMPAAPALHLVVAQPQLPLAAQEAVLHRPARVTDLRQLPQRAALSCVAQVVLGVRLLVAAAL